MTDQEKQALFNDYASWAELGYPCDADEIDDYVDDNVAEIHQKEARKLLIDWCHQCWSKPFNTAIPLVG